MIVPLMNVVGSDVVLVSSIHEWVAALNLARCYGWEPAGIEGCQEYVEVEDHESEPACTSGEDNLIGVRLCPTCLKKLVKRPELAPYARGEEDWIKCKDARELAKALKKALPDIPNHDACSHKRVQDQCRSRNADLSLDIGLNPFEVLSGDTKHWLRRLIHLLRKGAVVLIGLNPKN